MYKANVPGCYCYILTPSLSLSGSVTNTKTGPKVSEQLYRQPFGHNVRKLMRRWNMKHPDLSQSNLLMDEVNIYLNMLRATMMNWIGSHVDSTDIVAVDDRRRRDGCMKLLK